MIKVTGLASLTRKTDKLSRFTKVIDGTLVTVTFELDEHASVQATIRQMEAAVDAKAAPYRTNKLVMELAARSKERFRQETRPRVLQDRSGH